jgi:hypothetical protein
MNRIAVFLVSLFLAGCAAGPKPGSCPDCPAEKQFSTTIENALAPMLFVRADVNGQPKRFFLDTGAYRSIVLANEQTKKYPAQGKVVLGGMAWKPKECDWVKVDSFEIAGAHFSNAPLIRCEPDQTNRDTLGVDYINKQVLSLDIENVGFVLQPKMPKNLETFPMRRGVGHLIKIPVEIAGHKKWALFDTGCGITTVDQDFVSKHPGAFKAVTADVDGKDIQVTTTPYDSTGNTLSGTLYVTDQLKVGSITLPSLVVMAAPFQSEFKKTIHASMILGANAILFADWVLDLKNNVWAAKPITPKDSKGPKINSSADQFFQDGGLYTFKGNAKITQAAYALSAEKIVFDPKAGTLECTGSCVFNDGHETLKGDQMKILMVNGVWSKQN